MPRTGPSLKRLYVRAGENAQQAAQLLQRLIADLPEPTTLGREIGELESIGDGITHEIRLLLGRRRVPRPFTHHDGHALAEALDDIVDAAEDSAELLALYGVEAPMDQAERLAGVLATSTGHVVSALTALVEGEDMKDTLVEIHRLENEGAALVHEALGALFVDGADPMFVIRWKDIFAALAEAVHACETVAETLERLR